MCTLLCFWFAFTANSQKNFHFSDSTFTLGQKHILTDVRYALGGYNQLLVTDSLMLSQLDSVVQFLEKNNTITVEIGVHTDHRGSDTSNARITQFRAESVRNYLIARGIPSLRITAKGYGESQLVVPSEEIEKYRKTDKKTYEALHQRNRRTELKITGI